MHTNTHTGISDFDCTIGKSIAARKINVAGEKNCGL
jgi:hypothetical protein